MVPTPLPVSSAYIICHSIIGGVFIFLLHGPKVCLLQIYSVFQFSLKYLSHCRGMCTPPQHGHGRPTRSTGIMFEDGGGGEGCWAQQCSNITTLCINLPKRFHLAARTVALMIEKGV